MTSSTRIPLLANGTIDLECGSTTNNADRLKQVAFTNTHFLTATRFVSKKSSNLNSIDELKGKSVVSSSPRRLEPRPSRVTMTPYGQDATLAEHGWNMA